MKRIVMATAMAMLLTAGTAFAEGGSSSQQGQGGSGSMGSSSDESVGGSGSMSGSSQQQQSGKASSGAAAQSAQKNMLTVKEVDQANNTITFEAQVSPNAKIMSSSGQKLSLDQVKEGDQVRANFDPKTGSVQKVTVQSQQQQQGQGGAGSQSGSESQGGSGSESGSKY